MSKTVDFCIYIMYNYIINCKILIRRYNNILENIERLLDKGIINRPKDALNCFRIRLQMSEVFIKINLENLKNNPQSKFLRKEILRGLSKRRGMKKAIKQFEHIMTLRVNQEEFIKQEV